SERDSLQEQLGTNENALNERAEENMQLSSQLEDLAGKLEQHSVGSQRIEEEFTREKDMLTGELNELKEQVKSTQEKLSTQQQQLNERDKELADSKDQIDALTNNLNSRVMASEQLEHEYQQEAARLGTEVQELKETLQTKDELFEQRGNELESGANEIASLNKRINELSDEIHAQAASLQMQSESHASSREELESRINDKSVELESMHASQKELKEHAEKLENLNRALHESSISENDLHKAVLDDKNNIIESLRAKLAAACEPSDEAADNSSLIDNLHAEIHNLESKLQQSEPTESSAAIDALRDETGKLKAALAVSEEQREQLQTALANTGEVDDTNNTDQSRVKLESQPVAETADRNRFVAHLNTLLAEPSDSDKNHTVMYILLDNFIRVRDEIGIMNSEHVIKEISEIIASCCDDNDTVTRFGDCTFAVLSRHESTDETQEKAEKIRASVEHHIFEISGHSMITSTSIGICRIRDNDTRAEDIISRADLSCEAARSSGGNKVMVNSAVTEEMITLGSNVNHEKMISAALAEDRMMIYYQPISSLKGNQGNHFEILVRIVDESGNTILPGEFFSMAETTGQAVDIDLYVIEKVIRMIAENRDQEMTLFIKLTRQTVADHDFALWVIGKINEYKINPEKLVFEISENTLQSNLKNLSMLSKALHAIGCRIAIEHYRMSTKPQHLLHIHTDYLKI
ncbi:EAL domain-containing protein, partial [Desulfosarcina sp.]|nr:EAL domain-containing protein [Desulfosarcina sp.]